MNYYEVAPVSTIRTNKPTLTYHFNDRLAIGQVVRISIVNKAVTGVIIEHTTKKPSYKTKPIETVLNEKPVPRQLLNLASWLGEYYQTALPIVWQTLLPSGVQKKRRIKNSPTKSIEINPIPKLTPQQAVAKKTIESRNSGTFLIHGATGSGKTLVYIDTALEVLKNGKSSIILVPEIGLTAQLIKSFTAHLSPVFVTHSRMGESERHSTWTAIANHDGPCVIVGPRSALFSPRGDIGLIVIDEFHEPTYKQDQNPKYSTLRTAATYAKLVGAKLIIGSATPGVVEKYLSQHKSVSLIEMPKSAMANAKSDVRIVDLNIDKPISKSWLSLPAKKAIDWAIKNKKQVLVFHNRRGTASSNQCNNCGWIANCPTCHLPLTLHADWHQLRCHICDYKSRPFTSCPDCKNTELIFRGMGTKQLAADLESLFPNSTIARFDTDNSKDQTLEARYDDLHSGKIDIIVGTQTIAKGLDLPNLDVVIVPLADVGLFIPDFTASERTYQLLHQVAGRAGRHNDKGRVFIQTYSPDNPAISFAANDDYAGFYKHELQQRELAKYPPFVHLLKITAEYASANAAQAALRKFAGEITSHVNGIQILGPAPAFHERFHDRYRWQIVIKSRSREKLIEVVKLTPQKYVVDLDPSSLL